MNSTLCAVGDSKSRILGFLRLLERYPVERPMDVMSFSASKLDDLRSENLKRSVGNEEIEYFSFGDLFRDYRKGGYEQYTKGQGVKREVDLLEREYSMRRAALVCVDIVP